MEETGVSDSNTLYYVGCFNNRYRQIWFEKKRYSCRGFQSFSLEGGKGCPFFLPASLRDPVFQMLLLVSSAAVSQNHSSPPQELAFLVNPAQGKGERWNCASHFIFFLPGVESHRSLCSQNCGKVDRSRIYACGGIGNSSSGSCNPNACLGTCLNFNKEVISILGEGLSTVI